MNIKLVVILFLKVTIISSIEVRMVKRNLFIPQNSHFESAIELQRENAQLIPTSLSLQTSVTNSIPKFGDYFDYFYLLTDTDLACYQNAIQNQSFLFPCSFLANHLTKNRITQINSQLITEEIEDIIDANFSFIVDNTLFPYPSGAYSYSNINVDVATILKISVSSSYEILGTRLIFINTTIFLIFLVIIITLMYKTNAIIKKMNISKRDSTHENKKPYLKQRDDDYESSFISEEAQVEMIKQNESPEVFFNEEPVKIKKIRSSRESDAKVKSGLIQYLSSRVDDE